MRLKKEIDLLDFLKHLKNCKGDVRLRTTEGDLLNLKSTLSQYIFVSIGTSHNSLLEGSIECTNDSDRVYLRDYLSEGGN